MDDLLKQISDYAYHLKIIGQWQIAGDYDYLVAWMNSTKWNNGEHLPPHPAGENTVDEYSHNCPIPFYNPSVYSDCVDKNYALYLLENIRDLINEISSSVIDEIEVTALNAYKEYTNNVIEQFGGEPGPGPEPPGPVITELELVLGLRWDVDGSSNDWVPITYSANGNYSGGITNNEDLNKLHQLGLNAIQPSEWDKQYAGPIGQLEYNPAYKYELTNVYTDLGETDAPNALSNFFIWIQTMNDGSQLVCLDSIEAFSPAVKSWKCKVTKSEATVTQLAYFNSQGSSSSTYTILPNYSYFTSVYEPDGSRKNLDPRYVYTPVLFNQRYGDVLIPCLPIKEAVFCLTSNDSVALSLHTEINSNSTQAAREAISVAYKFELADLKTAYVNQDKTPKEINSGTLSRLYDENGNQIQKPSNYMTYNVAYYYVDGERVFNDATLPIRMTDSSNKLAIATGSSSIKITIDKVEYSVQPFVVYEPPNPDTETIEVYFSTNKSSVTISGNGNKAIYDVKSNGAYTCKLDPLYEYTPLYINNDTDYPIPSQTVFKSYIFLNSNSDSVISVWFSVDSTISGASLVISKKRADLITAWVSEDKTPQEIGPWTPKYLYDSDGNAIYTPQGLHTTNCIAVAYYYVNGERIYNLYNDTFTVIMSSYDSKLRISANSTITVDKVEFSIQPIIEFS